MTQHLNNIGMAEALSLIEQGGIDLNNYLIACYDRIDAREARVGAWQHLRPREDVLKSVEQNSIHLSQSPLKGLPIAVKDVFDTADMPTEMGSPIHKGRRPVDDAAVVSRLRQAGASIIGKTVTTEFAFFTPGKTANPRDLRRTPGGSSSGSAAAVADGMVPAALGTQTAASVIRPAAYCGIAGYVATRGTMSLRGVQPLAQSFDSLGILARSCADIRLLRQVVLGRPDSQESYSCRLDRVVVLTGEEIGDCSPDMKRAVAKTADVLQDLGCSVVSLEVGLRLKRLVELHGVIMAFEAAGNMCFEAQRAEELSGQFAGLLDAGLNTGFEEYASALREVETIRAWLEDEMSGGTTAILAPAAPGVAPKGLNSTGAPHMSRPWQAMGLPVVTVPGQSNPDGLPLGVQLIGARFADADLLAVGEALQDTLKGT